MPLWGLSFQVRGKEYSDESEAAVKRRISALLDYLGVDPRKIAPAECGAAIG
jgi:hypothetical protein